MKGRGTALLLAVVTAVSLLSGVRPMAAGADDEIPSADPNVVDANSAWQASVLPLVSQLQKAGSSDTKFAVVALEFDTHTVVVYRKGGASSSLYSAAIAANPTVNVRFGSSRLSDTESKAAMEKASAKTATLATQGIKVTGVTSNMTGPVVLHTATTTAPTTAIGSLGVKAASALGMSSSDIVLKADGIGATVNTDGQYNDTNPYSGGSAIVSAKGTYSNGTPNSASCSSAFTGRSRTNGKKYLFTAWHCTNPKDMRFWTAAGGNAGYLGKVSVVDKTHDMVIMPVQNVKLGTSTWVKTTRPYIWTGMVNDPGSEDRVTGTIGLTVHTWLCTSGAMSGRRCGNTTNSLINHKYCSPFGGCWTGVSYLAEADGGFQINAAGDSGGPVYINAHVPGIGQWAVGVIDGSLPDSKVPCTGTRAPTVCYKTVVFNDVVGFAARYDVDLMQ
jgi:hypothetical protein